MRSSGNQNAAVLAGHALAGAARRVDTAIQATRVGSDVQSAWDNVRSR